MRSILFALLWIGHATFAAAQLASTPSILVREIHIDGNSLIPQSILDATLPAYVNRSVSAAELQGLAQRLTAYLVEQGYVSSGIVVPDQKIEDGVVRLQLQAGRIAATRIQGNQRLRDAYVRTRLGELGGEALNVKMLAQRLQLLQQDPRIEHIDASVTPSIERGAAILNLDITERRVHGFSVETNNHISPNVGEQQLTAELHHRNLLGFGDSILLSYNYADGFEGSAVSYAVPITAKNTTVGLFFEDSRSQIVSRPFDVLDIEGESTRYGIEFRHPFIRTPHSELTLGIGLETQAVRSFLLGEPFAFASADSDGASKATVITFTQEWVRRESLRVLALRSTFHAGIDALDATIGGGADSEFLYWLGQAQWLQRLEWRDSRLGVRVQGRLANDALPSYRKYALGGAASVRGYRENLLVRDNGALFSAEWSLPVAHWMIPGLSRDAGDGEVRMTPFIDYGFGKDDDALSDSVDLASIGVAFEWRIAASSHIELQFAKALIDRAPTGLENTLQDEGVHFSARIGW
jgi:hemolysin activation/secretion protein